MRHPDEYVNKAIALARNQAALAKIRMSLRGCMLSSSLLDARRFAEELERAYRAMWHTWCRSHHSAQGKRVCV